jgi:glucosamine-6-phosphate deaminase
VSVSLEVHPAAGWADAVAAELIGRLRAEPRLRLCLPTGETPAPLYAALVRDSPPGLWSQATVVLLDEYLGLGPDDPAAGGPRLRRELLDAVRPGTFHAIDAADPDPEAAAERLDAIAAEGLDLALLGLGVNGHIGLNEPGSRAEDPTRVVTLEARSRTVATDRYGAAAPPERGITLGIARLLTAREIWLLVTGERKAGILAEALHGPESAAVPATFVRRHPRLRVLPDEPAAALLGPAAPQ